MIDAVCTLYEGDYHYGVGALVNSLARSGFAGVVVVAVRGERPPWAEAGRDGVQLVTDALSLKFVDLDWRWHLANYKAALMRDVFDAHAPEAGAVFYFDPDVVVLKPWRLYSEWARFGVAICCNNVPDFMPATHPMKRRWRVIAEARGHRCRDVDHYVNSGFVGVQRADRAFLDVWHDMIEAAAPVGGDMDAKRLDDDKDHPFAWMDQDALNAAMLASDAPLSLQGFEAMGFHATELAYMAHAIGDVKPWQRGFLWRRVSQGRTPRFADRQFWRFVDGPIEVFSAATRRRVVLAIQAARVAGRLVPAR